MFFPVIEDFNNFNNSNNDSNKNDDRNDRKNEKNDNKYEKNDNCSDDNNNKNNVLFGNPVKAGYNSHWVLTGIDGHAIKSVENSSEIFDELVIAQEKQIVPAFVLQLTKSEKLQNLYNYKRNLEIYS